MKFFGWEIWDSFPIQISYAIQLNTSNFTDQYTYKWILDTALILFRNVTDNTAYFYLILDFCVLKVITKKISVNLFKFSDLTSNSISS